jgi:hypothetical protein
LGEIKEMEKQTKVERDAPGSGIPFVLGFAEMEKDLTQLIDDIKGKLSSNDPILWIAYPKKSSKSTSQISTEIVPTGPPWEKWGLKE